MAFICIKNDEKIYSFIYSLKDWIVLKEDKSSSFNMACCGNQAILKTSKLGTQFFAHKTKPKDSNCSTGGETAEHMHIKYLVMKELDRNGWVVEVEKAGLTPSGEEWIADIYAEKGKAKIAIEVQWSPQAFIETKRRQEKYAQSGVRCAWLLRSGSVKDTNAITGDYAYSTKDIPVFSIYRNKTQDNQAYMIYNVNRLDSNSSRYNHRSFKPITLPLESFIQRLVSQGLVFIPYERFTSTKFRFKSNGITEMTLGVSKDSCAKCGYSNPIISEVRYKEDYKVRSKKIKNCSDKELRIINTHFSKHYVFSPIKKVRSEILNKVFIVNTCVECGFVIDRDGQYSTYLKKNFTKPLFIKHLGLNTEKFYTSNTTLNTECVYRVNNSFKIKYNESFEFGKWVTRDSEPV